MLMKYMRAAEAISIFYLSQQTENLNSILSWLVGAEVWQPGGGYFLGGGGLFLCCISIGL